MTVEDEKLEYHLTWLSESLRRSNGQQFGSVVLERELITRCTEIRKEF